MTGAYRCTLCGGEIGARIDSGDSCPRCKAPARTRSLPVLLDQLVPAQALRERLPLLVFAPLEAERKALAGRFATLKPVTLYGSYGGDLERGVDARDLARYADGSFCGHLSIALFDYFTEHDKALAEALRVLAPGGLFATQILDARVREDASAPVVTKKLEKRPGYYDYWPEGVDILSINVGAAWLVQAMERAGFEDARHIAIPDPVSRYVSHWFVGRKPEQGWMRKTLAGFRKTPQPPQPPPVDRSRLQHVAAVPSCTICRAKFPPALKQDECPACGAPSRLRSLPLVWNRSAGVGERVTRPLLGFALTGAERRFLAQRVPSIVSVSLYGDYGAGHIERVDARDLSRFETGAFSAVFSILLFDYFFEHERALGEAARVLETDGLFMTCILDSRVSDDASKPAVIKTIEPKPGYFDYVPAGKALLSVRVGSRWFLDAMERAGMEARYVVVNDAISTQKSRWFIGRKR